MSLERLKPVPFSYITTVDLLRPFLLKNTVKHRTKVKVYGVISIGFSLRSVYLHFTEGYDIENFLMTLRKNVYVRDFPHFCTLTWEQNL